MPAPQQGAPPPKPTPPLPPTTITDQSVIKQRQPSDKIENPFERQASMIVDSATIQAAALAQNMGDMPTNHDTVPEDTTHEMWHFSPYGMDAPTEFWRQHDELVRLAMQNGDKDPYAVAEQGAMQAVYPYRYQLAMMDSLNPEQRVARAKQLLSITNRQVAKGNTPDAMPTIVGPRGLPSPQQPAPDMPPAAPPSPSLPNSSIPPTQMGAQP